jgi:hypothetical protein
MLTGVSFDQVTFDNTNLTVVDWGLVHILGDEHTARAAKGYHSKPNDCGTRLKEFKAAVRANRLLAMATGARFGTLAARFICERCIREWYQ